MMRHFLVPLAFLLAASAAAQPNPIFEPDDSVDPRQHQQPVFSSRLVLGGGRGLFDHYRALGGNAGFLHITNTLYRGNWQFGFSHTETHVSEPQIFRCDCKPPIYFPTPSPTPDAPQPGPKNALAFSFYQEKDAGPGPPIMLRYRLTYSRQQIDNEIRSVTTEQVVDHRFGHEQSVGLDADTHFELGGHALWGTLTYAQTWSSGTVRDRSQQEFVYTARPPGWAVGRVLMRTTFTVGGVTNRGGTALNVVNPAFEAFWHSHSTKANVRVVWSQSAMRDGSHGWHTRSQIAAFVDRGVVWFLH